MIDDLERRMNRAVAAAGSEAHRTRIRTGRWEQERAKAHADRAASPLKLARLDRGLSQRTLALLCGCSRETIRRAESGDDTVTIKTWARIANVLGVRVADIT